MRFNNMEERTPRSFTVHCLLVRFMSSSTATSRSIKKQSRKEEEEKKVCKRSLAFLKICVRAQAKRYAGH